MSMYFSLTRDVIQDVILRNHEILQAARTCQKLGSSDALSQTLVIDICEWVQNEISFWERLLQEV